MGSKKISVIMGIYNCADTLRDALGCIVKQSYTDWNVIMCDDGSSDNTSNIAQEYVTAYPGKFTLIKNEKNMGLGYALNKCLQLADGDYIARMDGDDLCSSERFKIELEFFESHPECAIVSTEMEFFDEDGVWGRNRKTEAPQPKDLVKITPFCHAPCMVKREAYEAVGGYSTEKRVLRVEDYHLWVKMYSEGYRGMNIQKPLYSMRDDRSATARKKFRYRVNEAYVKVFAIRKLHLPIYCYAYCVKPILLGLLPPFVYSVLHHRKKRKRNS